MQVVSTLRMNGNAINDGAIQALAAAPTTNLYAGRMYYDTNALGIRFYNGTGFDNKATDSLLLGGNNSAYHLSRTNHTGSQLAATISDLAVTVKAYKLSDFAVPTANVAMNGFTFTGLNTTPNAAGQAAEYSWVLNQISSATSGIKAVKDPVRALITTNVAALTGIPSTGVADGVTLSNGDRVLLKAQTTGSQNQIWEVRAGAWTQPSDFDQSSDIESGTEVLVNEGTVYGGALMRLSTTGGITLGSTSLTWTQINQLNTYQNGNGLTLTGMVFAVQAVAGGGILVGGTGIQVDRSLVPNRYAANLGDGAASTFTVTHGLGTLDIIPTVREVSTGNIVYPDITITSTTQLSVSFGVSVPASNAYRITVIG